MFSKYYLLFAASALASWATPIGADTFFLKSGGQVDGILVNPDEVPRKHFVVQTPSGGRITLGANQVRRVLATSNLQEEYERRALQMRDTPDDHWKMAEWCRKRDLASKRKVHLQRVIEIDGDHAGARSALGFHRIDGRWTRPKEWLQGKGYVYYKGRWRTIQDADMHRRRQEADLAEKRNRRQIKTWRGWIGGRRDQDARDHMRAVTDTRAAPAFATLLKEETDADLKRLYIDVLARLGGADATAALIHCALRDKSESIRDRCLLELRQVGTLAAVSSFLGTLKHKDNTLVNRAADGLARISDSAAVLPLIHALKTEHKFIVKQSGGGINPTFGNGNGGLNVGGGGPKLVKRTFQNDRVLAALVELTGENFNFDRDRWLDWYERRQVPPSLNLRRDQ